MLMPFILLLLAYFVFYAWASTYKELTPIKIAFFHVVYIIKVIVQSILAFVFYYFQIALLPYVVYYLHILIARKMTLIVFFRFVCFRISKIKF